MSENIKGKIIEQRIGISPDYQVRALHSRNFVKANWHSNKWQALAAVAELSADGNILDLGTGAGNFELLFAGKVKKIVGVDYNDEALEFLRNQLKNKKIKNVSLRYGDLTNFSPADFKEKFDAIIMIDVIEHIEYGKITKLISSFKKILTPGGKVVIITPNYGSSWGLLEWVVDKLHLVPHMEGEQHVSKFNKKKLVDLFTRLGFNSSQVKTFNLFSFGVPTKKLAAVLCKAELGIPFPVGNLLIGVFNHD